MRSLIVSILPVTDSTLDNISLGKTWVNSDENFYISSCQQSFNIFTLLSNLHYILSLT